MFSTGPTPDDLRGPRTLGAIEDDAPRHETLSRNMAQRPPRVRSLVCAQWMGGDTCLAVVRTLGKKEGTWHCGCNEPTRCPSAHYGGVDRR
jgi:hypothetical protein